MKEVKIYVEDNGEVYLTDKDGKSFLLESYDVSVGGFTAVSASSIYLEPKEK